MLVLSRKQQEQIRIGDDVTITVVRIRGNMVRIGIEAPRSTRVVRAELAVTDPAAVEVDKGASELGQAEAIGSDEYAPPADPEAGAERFTSACESWTLRDRLRRHWPIPVGR